MREEFILSAKPEIVLRRDEQMLKNEDLILERFGFYADIDDEKIYDYLPIVRSAMRKIERKLLLKQDDEVWEDRLIVLGALICYHHYCMMSGEGRAVSIGGVSVGASVHSRDVSAQMLDEQYADCSDLLMDDDFLFRQVG